MAGEERPVEIALKTIGPGRPTALRTTTPIKVRDLRRTVAAKGCHSTDQLKLILRGKSLLDRSSDEEDSVVRLEDGDTLIVAVLPKLPPKHLHEGLYDDDDDDLKFHMPESEMLWKRKLFSFLKGQMKLPDFLLMVIFSISLKAWTAVIIWFLLAPVAYRWDLGPLYPEKAAIAQYDTKKKLKLKYLYQRPWLQILGTGFSIILLNLGNRREGDASAYSIFNEDFRELPGTLNADRLDRDIRAEGIGADPSSLEEVIFLCRSELLSSRVRAA